MTGRRTFQGGVISLALLLGLAVFSGMAVLAAETWEVAAHRSAERELLFVGNEYRVAIGRYYQRSPGTLKRYPPTLEDLLDDKRFLQIERHLRKMYADPLGRDSRWAIVMAPEGGIMGVHSTSSERPLKTSRFQNQDRAFEGAGMYSEWAFIYRPVDTR